MKTPVWVLVLVVVASGFETFADGEKSPALATTAAVADAAVVDGFWKDFSRAKELEALMQKAEKRFEELGRGKEFLSQAALEAAEKEVKWWRDKYYDVIGRLWNYTKAEKITESGVGNDVLGEACGNAANSEKVKTAGREVEAAGRAAKEAEEKERALAKGEEDLTAAGKTQEAKEMRDRIAAAKQTAEKARGAARKAHDDCNQALFEELKRAEAAGKLPPPSNARQKADAEPQTSEPPGGTEPRGDGECLPGPGPDGPIGVKTTRRPSIDTAGQDAGGVQRTNSPQPRIFYLPLPSFRAGNRSTPVAGDKK